MDEIPQPEANSSTRSPTRLPRELIREILSFFCNDRVALEDYALVAYDWLLESRPLLFQHIDISDFANSALADRFISNVLHSERLRPWLPSIRHISFCRTIQDQEGFILDISERLSNLRTLTWQLDRHPHPFRAGMFRAFSQFARLYHLELVMCTFASFEDLKKVIVALPALTSLTLLKVAWYKPTDPNERSLRDVRPTVSKVSVSTVYFHTKKYTNDVLLWLATTPTHRLLRELSLDIAHIAAALQLIARRSEPLAALDIQFYDDDDVELLTFGDNTRPRRSAELRQLFAQVGAIELLRLRLTIRDCDDMLLSWTSVGRVLRAFASAASVRRLRLCCGRYGTYTPLAGAPEWGAPPDLSQLDQVLGACADSDSPENAFHALRAVEFATYHRDPGEGTLEEHYALCCVWVQRTLPKLHERGIAEVYIYE